MTGNCLFYALLAKIKNPIRIKLHMRVPYFVRELRNGESIELSDISFPHFTWEDTLTNKKWHFSHGGKNLNILNQLLYKGKIKEFDPIQEQIAELMLE